MKMAANALSMPKSPEKKASPVKKAAAAFSAASGSGGGSKETVNRSAALDLEGKLQSRNAADRV